MRSATQAPTLPSLDPSLLYGDHARLREIFAEEAASIPPPPALRPDPSLSADILRDLDEAQAKAAAWAGGPLCVLAPAGSGKTRVLVRRVRYLRASQIDPGSILVLAFNRKAAEEIRARLGQSGHDAGPSGIMVKTFHSFALSLLVKGGAPWALDPGAPGRFLEAVHPDQAHLAHALDRLRETLSRLDPVDAIGVAESPGLSTDCRLPDSNSYAGSAGLLEDLAHWQNSNRCLDFPGMLHLALRELLADAALRSALRLRYRWILVDEYQDLSASQHLLVDFFSSAGRLFAVGDDDQCIYGWRGADVRRILDFEAFHPGGDRMVLGRNYRSAERIVRHAAYCASHLDARVEKAFRHTRGESGMIEVITGCDRLGLARRVAAWVKARTSRHGVEPHRCAVLSRHLRWLPVLAGALAERGVPTRGFPHALLAQNAFGAELASRLRLTSVGEAAERAFRALMEHPGTPLPAYFRAFLDDLGGLFKLPYSVLPVDQRGSWHAFTRGLAQWLRIARAPQSTLSRIAERYAALLGKPFFWPHEHQAENPSVFVPSFLKFAPAAWTVGDFLAISEGEVEGVVSNETCDEHGGVSLLTMHAAKGKEYACVACYRFGDLDHSMPDDPEEEKRLRYVAMTRAEDKLLLACDRPGSHALRQALLNPRWRYFDDERLRLRQRWAKRKKDDPLAERLSEELRWRKAFRRRAGHADF
jgi:DNA helicase-2/ATP-dependent DNA helicase PcrA